MSLEIVLLIIASAIIFTLIMMLAQKSLQGKRLTIVGFCKNVIITMIGCFVGAVVEKYNWPKWIMYTVSIVVIIVLIVLAEVFDIDKDNDESD